MSIEQRKPLVLGNWKMNGSRVENTQIIHSLISSALFCSTTIDEKLDCGICPPSLYLQQLRQLLENSSIGYGAQDVSTEKEGAYTGEIAASMLADLGCQYILVGHSERRQYHHEKNELIAKKVQQVLAQKMIPVYCVGETLEQRESKQHQNVIKQQIDAVFSQDFHADEKLVIAYEPVWAIGTGQTASSEQAQTMHQWIRQIIMNYDTTLSQKIRILYGGSVNENNAEELSAQIDIDGFLVGGASLKPQSFIKICEVFI